VFKVLVALTFVRVNDFTHSNVPAILLLILETKCRIFCDKKPFTLFVWNWKQVVLLWATLLIQIWRNGFTNGLMGRDDSPLTPIRPLQEQYPGVLPAAVSLGGSYVSTAVCCLLS